MPRTKSPLQESVPSYYGSVSSVPAPRQARSFVPGTARTPRVAPERSASPTRTPMHNRERLAPVPAPPRPSHTEQQRVERPFATSPPQRSVPSYYGSAPSVASRPADGVRPRQPWSFIPAAQSRSANSRLRALPIGMRQVLPKLDMVEPVLPAIKSKPIAPSKSAGKTSASRTGQLPVVRPARRFRPPARQKNDNPDAE